MYYTDGLNQTNQTFIQKHRGGEGHTEETTTIRKQSPVQVIQTIKVRQPIHRQRKRRGRVRAETESEGSTYFLPPFFLLPCCFDFAAGPPALPLPLSLAFAALAASAFLAFCFPVGAAFPFFPFSSFFLSPPDFFPPLLDKSCQQSFQKWARQRKVATTITQKTEEAITDLFTRKFNLFGKVG